MTATVPEPALENTDRDLLRRFEPILCFTKGESFFPLDPADYVACSSLWVKRPGRASERLAAAGALTLDTLGMPRRDVFGAVHFLRYGHRETKALAAQAALRFHRSVRRRFHAGPGRLARVGYVSRFIDALFTLVLLLRGRLPGGAAASAFDSYACSPDAQRRFYCGRVVRTQDWVALQYWFFYAYNNWRSAFFGANDHEADWEMVTVYLAPDEADLLRPEWVAYASHDFSGDDLRRHWSDPELERRGGHPVVYAAAGSHASFFTPGEYLTEIELPFLRPLSRLAQAASVVWHGLLRQYRVPDELEAARAVGPSASAVPEHGAGGDAGATEAGRIFRVPFVDYARGDGPTIGPGGDEPWEEPRLLTPDAGWATDYRGLWGLYAEDPFAGEDAPAGPRFNRDGSERRAWRDPVGWAGLDKVVPLAERLTRARAQRDVVAGRLHAVRADIDAADEALEAVSIEVESMRGRPHLRSAYQEGRAAIAAQSDAQATRHAEAAREHAVMEALDDLVTRLEGGEAPPPRAHLRRPMRPAPRTRLRLDRWAELWAAVSIGLAMITVVAIWTVLPAFRAAGLVAAIGLFFFIEAGFRGRLTRMVTSTTLALTVVSALVLLYAYFWQVVIAAVLITGAYIIWENVRELWV